MSGINEILQRAYAAHRAGNQTVAEQLYREALAIEPEHRDATHYLGLLRHQQGASDEGEKLIRQSLVGCDDRPNYFNNLGVVLSGKKDFAGASQAFRRSVELRPNDVESLRNFGLALHQQGEVDEALKWLRRVVQLAPLDVLAVSKLAAVLRDRGNYDEAISLLQYALRPGPNAVLHHELAETFRHKKDEAQALAHYEQVATLLPDSAEAHHNLAEALREASRLHDSLKSSRHAVELAPNHVAMRYSLANALKDLDLREEAVAEYEEVLRRSPGHSGATHLLAALRGVNPDGCAPDYVERLFDRYAPKFEEHLTERLYYQGPELLWQAFQNVVENSPIDLNVIDLGCGTGLCGVIFRPVAKRLVGVDLSSGMLESAAAKGCYDELVKAEITDFLRERPGSAQLIVAGDVLNYLGDLSSVFAACHGALTAGWLTFCVERGEVERYQLDVTGRFKHSPAHVEQLAQRAGFAVRYSQRLSFRFDRGQPVHGQFYVLEK